MPPRIVLFGATGYTGRLAAEALAAAGARPLLAGRDRARLAALAGRLGGLEVAEADTARPGSVRDLVGPGDVLVSTVGPYVTRGEPAVRAAIGAGAAYLDIAGEPPFLRRVFEELSPAAAGRCGLVPAFGYDFVPGNLAGALALAEAAQATRVAVGYFATGGGGFSSGTLASGAGMALEPAFAWRDGRLRRERTARRLRTFRIGGRDWLGVSYGGSEHYALPRLASGLRQVEVYLGWFGRRSRAVQAVSALAAPLARLPGTRPLARAAAGPLSRRTGRGPDEAARSRGRTLVVAEAADERGRPLARVHLRGPDPYTLTARLLAWGARRAASHGLAATGALGPVDAFGLDALQAGAAEAGLERVELP
ncbi:MAG TPA: saccharopine dehydrogenase NADP-binding domain-containing protein [Actinomycetota bacterium]|nr:saccharopine dehydrogenase NADP-binding domain-containing protein [Actinomycetota bacterium]